MGKWCLHFFWAVLLHENYSNYLDDCTCWLSGGQSLSFGLLVFYLNMDETQQNLISPFCDDKYFTSAMHFLFQYEILKINLTAVFNLLEHLSRRFICELIVVYAGIGHLTCPSVVNIFKRLLLLSRYADSFHNSHIASIGRGNETLCFCSSQIRTLVVMAT